MIDKPFLENELKRLGDQYQTAQKQAFELANLMQQLLGAMQVLQGLLKKAELDVSAAIAAETVLTSED